MIRGWLGRVALVTLVVGGLGAGACVTTPPTTVAPPATAAPPPATPSKKVLSPPPAPEQGPAAPPRVLAPQLSAREEEQLRREASARIESAEELVKNLGERELGHSERDTFATIQNLLVRARTAFAEANLNEALKLADKAQVLAKELSQSAR